MKWFYEYLKLIRDGKLVAKEVKLALDRIPDYLNRFDYDPKFPNALINFIENFIYLQKGGTTENKPMRLQIEQKFWIELTGFKYKNSNRQVINDIGLILGAGSGKSTFMAALSLAYMIVGSFKGNDVLIMANSVKQAQETFRVASEMVRDDRSLLYELNKKDLLRPIINKIQYYPTNSQIEVKAMDNKTADGGNVRLAIFDEFHGYTTNVIENVRKSSAPKRLKTGFTIWYISTNGQVRESVFDDYYNRWEKILNKEIEDYSTFPIIYKLDNVNEVLDVSKYEKAMPFINTISSPEIVKEMLLKVKGNPAGQAEILAKSFNLPQSQFNALFTTQELENSFNLPLKINNSEVGVGWDMSAIDDLSSICIAKKDDNKISLFQHSWIPEETFHERTSREQRLMYAKFIAEGSLELIPGNEIKQEVVFEYLENYLAKNNFIPIGFSGDAYYSKYLQKNIALNYGKDYMHVVSQSVRDLSEPTKKLKAGIQGSTIKINDRLSVWALNNVRVKQDANNNIYPNKQKAKGKIDPVLAMIHALISWNYKDDDIAFEWG